MTSTEKQKMILAKKVAKRQEILENQRLKEEKKVVNYLFLGTVEKNIRGGGGGLFVFRLQNLGAAPTSPARQPLARSGSPEMGIIWVLPFEHWQTGGTPTPLDVVNNYGRGGG